MVDHGQVGAGPADQCHIHLVEAFEIEELLDRGGWQEQGADQVCPRVRLSVDMIREGSREWRKARREDGCVVEKGLEQSAFARVCGPYSGELLGR